MLVGVGYMSQAESKRKPDFSSKKRFEELEFKRPRLDGIKFKSIDQQHNDMLVTRIEEEEVRATIWD